MLPELQANSFSRTKARAFIEEMNLEESCLALATHWLSLWQNDALPPRARLSPANIRPFLPSLMLFDVVPDVSVTVRLAGTGHRDILGRELTGEDWVAAAPEDHRATRLKIFTTVANGALCVAHRRVAMTIGEDYVSEEILLPFAPNAQGVSLVLVYVNWKPEQFVRIKSVTQVGGGPLDFAMMPLR